MANTSSTSNHVTGLVDTIIVLRHHESGATVQRGIYVQRMRGSSHDNTIRELIINDRGVTVGPPLPAPNDQPLMP